MNRFDPHAKQPTSSDTAQAPKPGLRIVVKIGGAQLDEPRARAKVARSIARVVRTAGHTVVIVHGGGAQLGRMTDRLGLPAPRRVRGLRVTDPATAEAALCVLGGQVNRMLVHALARAGLRAVGMTGADGGLFDVRPIDPELGLVGEVANVDPAVLRLLGSQGYVPVIASLGTLARGADVAASDSEDPAEDDRTAFYNVNADQVVAPLARAFGADVVLFLTDTDGVRGADGRRLEHLDADQAADLIANGVIAGGMIPKVESALDAARACPDAIVRVAHADRDDALAAAMQSDGGTTFRAHATTDAERIADHG